jgi:hypothetical protein
MKNLIGAIYVGIAVVCYKFLNMSVNDIFLICLYARLLRKRKLNL